MSPVGSLAAAGAAGAGAGAAAAGAGAEEPPPIMPVMALPATWPMVEPMATPPAVAAIWAIMEGWAGAAGTTALGAAATGAGGWAAGAGAAGAGAGAAAAGAGALGGAGDPLLGMVLSLWPD